MVKDFIYADSRLRAMEYRILESAVLNRLADSEGIGDALKVLSDTVYGEWFSKMKNEEDFETVIQEELFFAFSEIARFVPDRRLEQMSRLPYDVHNLKVLLKGQIRKRRNEDRRMDLLTPLGNLPLDDLVVAVESEDFRLLPYGFHKVLPECMLCWDQNHDSMLMEKILDDALFSALTAISIDMGVQGVVDWVRTRIDIENIRNMIRLRRMGSDAGDIASFLHRGGWIAMDRLVLLLGEPVEGWDQLLQPSGIAQVLSHFKDTADLDILTMELEKALDDYMTRFIRKFRYIPFAPENVLTFLWRKEMDAMNVRIALVGLANGAERALLKGMFRHV